MSFLSRFSSSLGTEKASTGAATAAPPPPTIPEDSTTQPSISQAIDTQTSIGAHVETGQNPGAEEGLEHADDCGLAKILESMAVAEPRTEMAAVEISEGETPGKIVEGETPVEEIAEGETPVEKTTEGETPDQTGDETPGSVRGETPEPTEGGTPGEFSEEKTPDRTAEQMPVGEGQYLIVNLVDDREEEEPPVDERTERRRTRRSLLDEVDDLAHVTRGEVPAQGAVGGQEETPGTRDEAEESRLAQERKRKGKRAASIQPRQSKTTVSVERVEEPIPPPTKVPFAKESSGPIPGSESESEEVEEPEEEPNFERTEVWVTKELLEAMRRFDDKKRAATYKERSSAGKLAKSGKQYDPKELQEIESDEEFRACISAIGFEWLLKHSTAEVPVDLAREFFSTFRLKSTTDLDADSITFRLFNAEYEMSIREWSLRMGLFSIADDIEGIWNERMVCAPKHTPGFKAQAAWELVTHQNVGAFKSSYSKASHIDDRILRFAQTFISYNLMGTANSALTTTDLYFTWCMAKNVKVHLGYWLAQACHQMTGNPSRHMYTCHLLGAYLQRNVILKIAKSAPEVLLCEPPETFSVEYFFNKGLLQAQGNEVFFYDVGDKARMEPEGVEAVPSEEFEEMKKEMRKEMGEMRREMRKEMSDMRKEIRKEMGEMRGEISGVKTEVMALKGRVYDMVAKSSAQSDRMTEAVELLMKMTKWVEKSLPQTEQKLPPGPSGKVMQPGQGSSSLQRPPPITKPMTTPAASKPLPITKPMSNPSASKPLPIRKPMLKRPETEDEEPETPARKKVKMTRPSIPPQSGSRGGQTQK